MPVRACRSANACCRRLQQRHATGSGARSCQKQRIGQKASYRCAASTGAYGLWLNNLGFADPYGTTSRAVDALFTRDARELGNGLCVVRVGNGDQRLEAPVSSDRVFGTTLTAPDPLLDWDYQPRDGSAQSTSHSPHHRRCTGSSGFAGLRHTRPALHSPGTGSMHRLMLPIHAWFWLPLARATGVRKQGWKWQSKYELKICATACWARGKGRPTETQTVRILS